MITHPRSTQFFPVRDGWIWWPVLHHAFAQWASENESWVEDNSDCMTLLLVVLCCCLWTWPLFQCQEVKGKMWSVVVWELLMSISSCSSNVNVYSCFFVSERQFYLWMQLCEICSGVFLWFSKITVGKKNLFMEESYFPPKYV